MHSDPAMNSLNINIEKTFNRLKKLTVLITHERIIKE